MILSFIVLIGTAPAKETASQSSSAIVALQNLLISYAQSNYGQVESLVDVTMIGRQELVEGIRTASMKEAQIKVTLENTVTHEVGKDVVVVKTDWEKKYMKLPSRTEESKRGHSLFFMQKNQKNWKLVGQSGDNLFAP